MIDEPVRTALDETRHPVSIAASVRDHAGGLIDFRIEFLNAAADWTGQPREAIVGRNVREILPALRTAGLFDELCTVVETGRPFRRAWVRFVDAVIDGHPVGGRRLESIGRPALRLGFAT